MLLCAHLPQYRPLRCRQLTRNAEWLLNPTSLIRGKKTLASGQRPFLDAETLSKNQAVEWETKARNIRSGAQKSMLAVLEERGFVKDVAGGRKALDWLLTEKRIGAYVGVDPTAPSLHVGHLLPLMALYWMYLHGFHTVTLFGGGTVQIGDPSGRTTARARQGADIQAMNIESIEKQLHQLWVHVKCLGIKYKHVEKKNSGVKILNNRVWLEKLSAVDLMRDLGSGMRLGTMLSRDSVKTRMENGDGMAISEFCYPLFQAYDWWHMYSKESIQLQLGGSDQYGNICAGMVAVNHMRKTYRGESEKEIEEDPLKATFGLTTPLLTTSSGEKFGKSAGNAVWLDPDMMSSFDLYQYFLKTSDDDVERYLKLFTFIPLDHIHLVMQQQERDASQRTAQHLLAKEIVSLAHGASSAMRAEKAHKEAFSDGTHTFSLSALRRSLADASTEETLSNESNKPGPNNRTLEVLTYKKSLVAKSALHSTSPAANESTESVKRDTKTNIVTLPNTLLQPGSFPRVLYAAGLVASVSEGHRLIKSKGAYVVIPNSGSVENPNGLVWEPVPTSVSETDPNHYLIDWEALVIRSGKSKIQVVHIVKEERFEAEGLSFPGWEEFKAKRVKA